MSSLRPYNRPVENEAIRLLEERGIKLDSVARLVFELQLPYNPSLTLEECHVSVEHVLKKREVQYAVITGITLDQMAEEGSLKEPLGSIVRENHRLFAVDEILGLCIVNLYGTIGLSNFGYLGEVKPGCLSQIDKRQDRVSTFLDDLVSAIVAAACARIAHNAGPS